MTWPDPYDLLVILAGHKAVRHRSAVELMRRGWARHITVTGGHERIDPQAGLSDKILQVSPSTSTYGDAVSIRALVEHHRFGTVLVVTSAAHVSRARLTLRRVFRDLPTTIDVVTWEPVRPGRVTSRTRVLRTHLKELGKLLYFLARRRA